MRRPPALLILLAALALAGCSRRDRLNPLDPANPQTGGRPTGFNALAGYSAVRLTWDPRPDLDIDGFQLSRLAPGDPGWQPLGGTRGPQSSSYLDAGLFNGRRYRYRLDYVIRGLPAGRPAEDDATPGPVLAWVADPGARIVAELTPDGRDVNLRVTAFGEAYALAVDPADGQLWASSRFTGLLWIFNPITLDARSIAGVAAPYAMAVSPFDHSAWVCDLTGGLAHRYPDGTAATPGYIGLLDNPVAVAVSAFDASVWVCEGQGNRVRHFSALGVPLGAAFVGAPSRVAVDSLTRVAYVTSLDLGRLWRIGESGQLIDSTSVASGPIGIAIDRARNRVWVADARGARVLGLDLGTLALAVTVTTVGTPYDLAVDPATGEVWVVARAEGAVIRLAADGTKLDVLGGFTDPVQIRLDPGIY
jgi:DNA-binding beta-propeller fold protein YncE